MRSPRHLKTIASVTLAMSASVASATPPRMTILPEVVKASNVIVVGRVVSQRAGRETAPFTAPGSATIEVARTLKGQTVPPGGMLQVAFVLLPDSTVSLFEGDFGLFFLRCRATTDCVQATTHSLFAPALTQAPPGSSTDPLLRVMKEQLALLAADDQTLARLSHSVAPPWQKAAFERDDAWRLLRTAPFEPIRDDLRALAQVPDAGTRLAAVQALADKRDFSSLRQAEAEVLNPVPQTARRVRAIADSIALNEASPPELLALVANWLASSDVEVRRRLAHELFDAARPQAAVVLARRGLDDADVEVRYWAVVALMTLFGAADLAAPKPEDYARDEPRWRQRWLDWREANRVAIEQGRCCLTWQQQRRAAEGRSMTVIQRSPGSTAVKSGS